MAVLSVQIARGLGTERGDKGKVDGVLTMGRGEEKQPNLEKGRRAWVFMMAVLRWWNEESNWRRSFISVFWSSWRHWLALGTGEHDESATAAHRRARSPWLHRG
jgi:hypothetical protein